MFNIDKSIAFAVDCNVDIHIVSPQKSIRQSVSKHNKASRRLVSGMLRFIQGHFTTSFRQTDLNSVLYIEDAKNYIPCYVGLGTGGITLDSNGFPVAEIEKPREPILSEAWKNPEHFVNYTDTKLDNEMSRSVSRVEIGYIEEGSSENKSPAGDTDQFIIRTEIPPGHYNKIYGGVTRPIFCTEIGLFTNPMPNSGDLLAKVIIKEPQNVLYIRPQDTVFIDWTISIIALGDSSEYITPESKTLVDSSMNSHIPVIIENEGSNK